MKPRKVWAVYFSGTGTTEKTVRHIARGLAEKLGTDCDVFSYTLPQARQEELRFSADDLVVFGSPVYAGRVPNVLLPYLKEKVKGCGALVVPVVLYGNRNFDDGLIELRNILTDNGFATVAGAGFIGEHSFSRTLGAGRPDAADFAVMDTFVDRVAEKVAALECAPAEPVTVRGETPIRPYYTPRDRNSNPINILKVKPKTDADKCVQCGWCAANCPMGSINPDNCAEVKGICIKCCACVKGCPNGAKYYDDEGYLYHQHELEDMYARRAEPELFW
ncbi:MAG: EFR1 family ferrodoxin [Clostridiales bacterium]|nr:EFR1 family ferrodoxin [Candidatus Cacconaster stercorequi]